MPKICNNKKSHFGKYNIYYSNLGVNGKTYCLYGRKWEPYRFRDINEKKLYLPDKTLVYGEFVEQSPALGNKYPLTIFHIIDVAIIGGLDVTRVRFAKRLVFSETRYQKYFLYNKR